MFIEHVYPTTDIICLVHNQLSVTKGFVDHLFKNTDNFNLFFVDNNSTDGTKEFLDKGVQSDRWQVLTLPENLGVVKARNLGAKLVKSEYFLNIDNDQYVGPGWLAKLHAAMQSGFDIVGCEGWEMLPPATRGSFNGQVNGRGYYPHCRCTIQNQKTPTYIGCGGMLIKTSVMNEIGLFDEQFSPAYFEDPDFSFRAIQNGYKLGWVPDAPILHLAHQTIGNQALFNKSQQFISSWVKFRNKWGEFFPHGEVKKVIGE